MTDYSLTELARLADVTPRTVRYYIAQGLLPSPDAAGPATRYGDAHLARLRLIKRLQREHLPLAEIRQRLDAMSDAEIDAAAGSTAQPRRMDTDTALAYVRNLMAQSGVSPRFYARRAAGTTPDAPDAAAAPDGSAASSAPHSAESGADPAGGTAALRSALVLPAAPMPSPAPSPAAHATQPDRSTWERISLDPDVELHVRRPLDRLTNKRVDRLVRIARELFEDDTP